MKLFSYRDRGMVMLCWAFNRGHAVKQLAKHVEAKGHAFSKEAPIEEVPEGDPKGEVIVLREMDA